MSAIRVQAELLAIDHARSRRSPQVTHQGLSLSVRVQTAVSGDVSLVRRLREECEHVRARIDVLSREVLDN